MSIEAMKLALEALKNIVNAVYVNSQQEADAVYKANDAIIALEEALAKQEQGEPVAEVTSATGAEVTMSWWHEPDLPIGTKLYTTLQQRKPLTDEQRKAIVVCFTSGKVSISEVQRKLAISYTDSQQICQSIVDLGLCDGLQLAPSIVRQAAHGIKE
jgi:hypothetical protein